LRPLIPDLSSSQHDAWSPPYRRRKPWGHRPRRTHDTDKLQGYEIWRRGQRSADGSWGARANHLRRYHLLPPWPNGARNAHWGNVRSAQSREFGSLERHVRSTLNSRRRRTAPICPAAN